MTIPASRAVIVAGALALFAVTSVMPLAYMLVSTVGEVPLDMLWLDARQRILLYNTALLGVATALSATAIGVPLGFWLARMPIAGKPVVRLVLAAPVLLPPYTVALAWVYAGLSGWTYSLPAAAFVLALVYYPVVMLATEAALRQMDPHLEEAGLLASPPRGVLTRITLPLIAPAIGGAALIVFVLAISEFGVPALMRVRVYTTEVFTAFASLFDFARATALTLPLLILTAGTGAGAAWLLGSRVVAGHRRTGSTAAAMAIPGGTPAVAALAITVAMLAVALPVLVLVRESGDVLEAAQGAWPSIRISLVLAALGATCVVPIGGVLGYARARSASGVASFADVLWVTLFAVPSTIVGVALIGIWNRPGPAGMVYGTFAMLLLAYLARFVPVAALITAASVRQIPPSHEEAAAVAGAGWLRTMGAIVVPQMTRGLAMAWVIAFVFAFGELGASILVSPPGESTLPIRIYTIVANAPSSMVAALALLQLTVILSPLVLVAAAAARRPRS